MAIFRTPLSRARGAGAAGHGASHWISERVTSIALVPLCLWVIYSGIRLIGSDYRTVVHWLSTPLNAVLASLLAIIAFLHMHDGMRVVIEDYIHKPLSKAALLILNLFVCVVFAALALISILKVALGGY